ncbi:hypothetical protein ACIPV2_05780 [Microbacterium sp. NPDC089987]|uniref:hypothetical protein n=1 Tax=Microbacterium sp. NPDC089987 TaxID=3364202 RepID=UPI00380E6D40
MSFFPPDPPMPEQDDDEPPQPRWWQAPENELPVLIPASEVLAVTDHAAVALVAVAVYSDGIELRIQRRLRRNGIAIEDWNELTGAFVEHMGFGSANPAGRFRVGVVLADGTKVTDASPFFGGGDPMAEPEGFTLSRREQGGGGGPHAYSSADHLWLWPLPPDGPIEVVVQWPAFGIGETRLTIDAGPVSESSARARPFWAD